MKLRGVEAARGLAALLVVLLHATSILADPKDYGREALGGLFRFGHAGVDFFFVLSGFIILFIHARDIGDPGALPGYAWKRFARIFPTYWVVLVLFGAMLAVSPSRDLYERDPVAVVTSALLIPQPDHMPILGVAWSLSHEILFYALFAALFFSRRVGLLVLGVWGLLCLARLFGLVPGFYPGNFLLALFNIEFFFGLAVASALLRWPHGPPFLARLNPLVLLAAGLVLFFGTGIAESWLYRWPVDWAPPHFAYALGAALTLYGAVAAEREGRLGRVPALAVMLGGASYSIYLLHVPVVIVLQQVGRKLLHMGLPIPLELAFVVTVVAAVAACVVFSRLVEQPLLAWCRRRASVESKPVRRAA